MTFLIDTNIISEVRKGDRGNPAVAAWWNGVAEDDLWLSSLVLGELRKGVELARRRDIRRAEALDPSWHFLCLPGADLARFSRLTHEI